MQWAILASSASTPRRRDAGSSRASASGPSSTPRPVAGPVRLGRNTADGVVVEVEGAPTPSTPSAAGWAARRRRWPCVDDVAGPTSRSGRHRVHHRPSRAAGPHLRLPGRHHLRRLPGRPGRPGQPALPAPVRHLHQLRAALHDHHRPALRPADHDDGGASRSARPAREYADPADRRFHAQTVCCPDCGPTLRLVRPGRRADVRRGRPRPGAPAAARRRRARGQGHRRLPPRLRRRPNADAVATLRKRKQRGDKPFAVMVADLADARERVVSLDDAEAALLDRPQPARSCWPARDERRVRPWPPTGGARQPTTSGVMLAYTPLHHLLLGLPGDPPGPEVLVMTSGNLAGEPIVTDDAEALARLAGLADAWLTHDRPIHVPCDDSVTRAVAEHEAAGPPLPRLRAAAAAAARSRSAPALAVGGDLKNTFCLAEGRLAWMSGHVGDMDDLATLAAFASAERHLELLTGVAPDGSRPTGTRPTARAAGPLDARRRPPGGRGAAPPRPRRLDDGRARPRARTTRCSASRSTAPATATTARSGAASSCWPTTRRTTRLAHLAYVALPGGDAGVRNPCRMALSHLRAAGLDWDERLPSVRACDDDELGCSTASWRPASAASRPRAWAGSSTRWPRWPASATAPGTTPRPPWSSRPGPARRRPGYAFGSPSTRHLARRPRPGRRRGRRRRPGAALTPGWSPPGSTRPSSTWSSTWPSACATSRG